MVGWDEKLIVKAPTMPQHQATEYACLIDLDIYDSPHCLRLATQAAAGRHLRFTSSAPVPEESAGLPIRLCEDDYPGWLARSNLHELAIAPTPYQPVTLTRSDIEACLPAVIRFAQAALSQPNHYLWGGTIGPNYDCSGLMQAAFGSEGIWLPRDAYQQEAFTQPIALHELQAGDLVFFGTPAKATHVGLCLTPDTYIHSSGVDQGRNGIGIDRLTEQGDPVSQTYFRQLRGAGRVMTSYQPDGIGIAPPDTAVTDSKAASR